MDKVTIKGAVSFFNCNKKAGIESKSADFFYSWLSLSLAPQYPESRRSQRFNDGAPWAKGSMSKSQVAPSVASPSAGNPGR